LVDVESFQPYLTLLSALDLYNAKTYQCWSGNPCGRLVTYHSNPIVIILAPGCTIIGTVACGSTTVLDLCPSTTPALDLFTRITISKAGLIFQPGHVTYHASPVAAAEMPISVRGIARTVRTPLVTAIASTAGVLDLELASRDCGRTDGSGSHESAEESCELHDERVVVCILKRGVLI
jgi:hypothetical protein